MKNNLDSFSDADKSFILQFAEVCEKHERQLKRDEILRIVDLVDVLRGSKSACEHELQYGVFTDMGEETDEYECAKCHRRRKIPLGPRLNEL